MADFRVKLSEEERALLARIVEHELQETRVEYRRTGTPEFRAEVGQEEEIARTLLKKLQLPVHAAK